MIGCAPLYSIPHLSFTMTGLPVRSLRKGFGFTGTVCTRIRSEQCELVGGRCFTTDSILGAKCGQNSGSVIIKHTAAMFAQPSPVQALGLRPTSVKFLLVPPLSDAVQNYAGMLRYLFIFIHLCESLVVHVPIICLQKHYPPLPARSS